MRAIVVDDIADLRKHLIQMLKDVDATVSIEGEAENVLQAVELIRTLKPDVVFLDVEMPQYSGLELFGFLNESEMNIEVVFVTAHAHYAVKAFELSAVDYILKPVTMEALKRTLARLRQRLAFKTTSAPRLQTLQQQLAAPTLKTRIALSSAETIRMVAYEEILYLKANRVYTQFFLQPEETLLISKPLAEFEDILPKDFFLRIHRSYMVNLHHIKAYYKQDNTIQLTNGEQLPVAADKKELLLTRLLP
ncbi:MAG: response regulator [Chitinophagales bacterium]|nr:response regulator [Chitinophagales bacterium]